MADGYTKTVPEMTFGNLWLITKEECILKVRTRFAPSPTGFMHIGNLRTALYAYLFARKENGTFILRIEDTDRTRYVEGATEVIKNTLKEAGLHWDEGPDVGGDYAPYVQSERMAIYKKYADELVNNGHAYRCFCSDSDKGDEANFAEKGCPCRDIDADEAAKRAAAGESYAIRQKMPRVGETTYHDVLHGNITIENRELEDQILLKSDGMPTYNFANVIDDHLMDVTHIIRGEEFITSTPKHVLLYDAFGWDKPVFIHLAPVMGKNADGSTAKLSKRHGATGFSDLTALGYLPTAIVNYVALLGWNPKNTNEEIFSLDDLTRLFSLEGLSKSPAVFDYDKLGWVNGEYFKRMTDAEFAAVARPFAGDLPPNVAANWTNLAALLKTRLTHLAQIPVEIDFLLKMPAFDAALYENKRNKINPAAAEEILPPVIEVLGAVEAEKWQNDVLYAKLNEHIAAVGQKKGAVMWAVRIAVAGKSVTPGGATELLAILGKDEAILRLRRSLDSLKAGTYGTA